MSNEASETHQRNIDTDTDETAKDAAARDESETTIYRQRRENNKGSSDDTTTPVVTRHQGDKNKTVKTAHNRSDCSDSPLRLIPYLRTKEGPF